MSLNIDYILKTEIIHKNGSVIEFRYESNGLGKRDYGFEKEGFSKAASQINSGKQLLSFIQCMYDWSEFEEFNNEYPYNTDVWIDHRAAIESISDFSQVQKIVFTEKVTYEDCESYYEEYVLDPSTNKYITSNPLVIDPNITANIPLSVRSIGSKAFENCPRFFMNVYENSYAHDYALKHGLFFNLVENPNMEGNTKSEI